MGAGKDAHVIEGPRPLEALPVDCMGKIIHESLLFNKSSDHAMIDGFTGETLRYQKILEDSCHLAEAMRIYGCTSDTIVSISSENNLQFFMPVIASFFLGSPVAPLNHNYTIHELRHVVGLFRPKIVFSSFYALPNFQALKGEFPFLEKIIVIDAEREIPGVERVENFVRSQLRGRRVTPQEIKPFNGDSEKQVALIMCSSGTTGLPKGVMLTHRNLACRLSQSRDPRYNSHSSAPSLALLPLFHSYGLITFITNLCNKKTTIVMRRFEEDLFLKLIQDYKIPMLWLVPASIVFLTKTNKLGKYDLSSLKYITSGAAPLKKETEAILSKRLNLDTMKQVYGLTEFTMAVTMFQVNDKRDGSIGKVVPNVKMTVRDPETGKSLGPNQIGEICLKGPSVMKGYFENEKATREMFNQDGWLRSGDLGYYDKDHYFYIVGRIKELIKYKGYQVPPAELEAIIFNHPEVLDAGVVGKPDELAGEIPVAFVVKRPGAKVTEKELVDLVNAKVSPQKRLRGGVIFVDAIPKNASGKVVRRDLARLLPSDDRNVKSKL